MGYSSAREDKDDIDLMVKAAEKEKCIKKTKLLTKYGREQN